MRIVVFGLAISSSWGNGHATLWRSLCRALCRRGHSVFFFEHDLPYYAAARDPFAMPDGEVVLYSDWSEVLSRARRAVAESDVAIVTSYCPDGLAATDLVLNARSAVRVFYDLDTPMTLDALRGGQAVAYIGPAGLAGFDLVLSFTGGGALDELKTRLGAERVAPLYGHVDPDLYRPIQPQERFAADLSYLGTYAPDRQAALERLFIAPALRRPRRRFLIGGSMYPEAFPWSSNVFFVHHVHPADHAAFFSSCRLTLNVTRGAMAQMGWCPSGRLFEAAACGAPILSDSWEGLNAFFEPGEEILVAHTTRDVLDALELDDFALGRMAASARARVLAEHTSDRRAVDFEEALQGVAVRAG